MILKSAIATTTLLLLLLTVPLTWAQERAIRPLETNNKQALVIGNANYAHAGVLRNPANDAKAIGRTLEQLGFKVTTLTDADERQMDQAIRNFGRQLRGSNGVGLFYYAGHGMQIEGQNYLLPTDINPSNEFDVTYDAIPVGKLLGQMQVAMNGMNIVILDACRNNPFARSFRSSTRGLAQVIAPTGSFISYATAPGNVAADGEGENGLFTEKLLQHMTTPGLRLEEVFKRVRADVQRDSNNKQVPWDSSSVTGEFFFVPAEDKLAEKSKEVAPSISSDQDFAAQAWEVIKDSEDPRVFKAYMEKYPNSPQRDLAELTLMMLSKSGDLVGNSLDSDTEITQWIEPSTEMKFIKVKGGCYNMGSPHYEKGRREDEKLHEVCVSEIWVAAYEVTNAQYRIFKPHHRSRWISGYDLNGENQPVTNVNLVESREYAEWLTKKNGGTRFRLPNEAEWEYACRGGTKTARYWGDNPDLACKYGSVLGAKDKSKLRFEWGSHSCDDGYDVTAPVGSFLPNEWGLFDMLGNVFEWTEDAYSDYSKHSKNNPLQLSGDNGAIRGGAWGCHPNDVRCAYRFKVPISRSHDGTGFRLVRVE